MIIKCFKGFSTTKCYHPNFVYFPVVTPLFNPAPSVSLSSVSFRLPRPFSGLSVSVCSIFFIIDQTCRILPIDWKLNPICRHFWPVVLISAMPTEHFISSGRDAFSAIISCKMPVVPRLGSLVRDFIEPSCRLNTCIISIILIVVMCLFTELS